MSEATSGGQRAKRMALVAVGGSVVLTMALAPVAHADQITRQRSETTNNGTATANSGGNSALGNGSINTAVSDQTATGGTVASNSSGGGNTSNGTASIQTGTATANGNLADNDTTQVAEGDGGGGLYVSEQESFVTNTATALANSGDNTATGNLSDNLTVNTQDASGDVASNSATSTNDSDGTGEIATGVASATGNLVDNDSVQAVAGGVGNGVSVVTQTIDVLNSGDAEANSGGNSSLGNGSINTAVNDQTATGGLVGSNSATSGNTSNGTGSIITGAANAAGNLATNSSSQSVAPDASFLAVILQNVVTANAGIATASSGVNDATGNVSINAAINAQAAAGDVAANSSTGTNDSDGLGFLSTGIAGALGNQATNESTQDAS